MEHLGYLFAAYSIIFLLIGLYVVYIARRQARLERDVARLEASVRSAEDAATASEAGARD
ncbi:MAG: CcmD family protein [Candidatus Binataceae bacterium]